MRYPDVAIPPGSAWSSPFARWQGSLAEVDGPDLATAITTRVKAEDMNLYGCSLVFSHPQGPTGLRSIAEQIETLRLRGGGIGLVTGCAAGDAGAALVVEVTER